MPVDVTTVVRPPRPLLSRTAEARLRRRHREVLDALEALFLANGFATFSVRELAARVSCSRRTLYELAPSKEELVRVVLDRFLHRVGRQALAAIDPASSRADQIRDYFRGAIELQRQTVTFGEDVAADPGARRLLDRHFRYVMAVLRRLIEEGIAEREFGTFDATAVAAAMAGSGLYLNQPDAKRALDASTVTSAIDDVLDVFIAGMQAHAPARAQPSTPNSPG